MMQMENSANTVTSGGLEGQGRAVSMPKLNAEMQVFYWISVLLSKPSVTCLKFCTYM